MIKSALLVLKDETQFHSRVTGATGTAVGEVVLNTPMAGYQGVLTGPSCSRQIVILTYPRIGNVGTDAVDEESFQVRVQDLVIRNLSLIASNFRNTEDLSSYLKRHNIVTITNTDTHRLTRLLREKGAQNGCIVVDDSPDARLVLEKAKALPGPSSMDLAKKVVITGIYSWTQGSWTLAGGLPEAKVESKPSLHVVAYDFSAKRSTLCMPIGRGCRPTVVPAQISTEDVLGMNPGGIFLSNGPDDSASCDYAIDAIEKFLETDIPVFSICLSHQLLALASGTKAIKMKFGHHGGNHPVKDVDNNVVMITAQSHGFTADEAILPANLCVAHKSLFDGTLQDIYRTDRPALSFQGHLEASPGPYDAASLFDHFIGLIKLYHQSAE